MDLARDGADAIPGLPEAGGEDIYDITIIGAGPTGLFGAFYAGMRECAPRSSMLWRSRAAS